MSREEEIWMPIKDCYLEISSFGRVRSLDRYTKGKRKKGRGSGVQFFKGGIRNITITNKGYAIATYKRSKKISISKFVSETFVPNPENKKYIKHKDGNKLNNNANNLEWTNEDYKNKYTEFERKQIVEEYVSGKLSLNDVSLKYNVIGKTIGNWMRRFKMKPRKNSGWRDWDKINLVAQEYTNGGRTHELAEKYNVTTRTICKWLHEKGIQPLPLEQKLGYTEEFRQKVVDMYNTNLTCQDVSGLLNVKRSFVYEVVRKYYRDKGIYSGIKIKGGRGNYFGTKGSIETRFGVIRYDSLYERDRIIQHNRDNNIKNLQRGKFNIPYIDGLGKRHVYRPDFFIENIDSSLVIEEVKPISMLDKYNNEFKHQAAEGYCKEKGYIFRVICENEIYGEK